MGKKNSGINDKDDASGEQSAFDGNSGIANTLDGAHVPEPPDQVTRNEVERAYRDARTPTKRKADVM